MNNIWKFACAFDCHLAEYTLLYCPSILPHLLCFFPGILHRQQCRDAGHAATLRRSEVISGSHTDLCHPTMRSRSFLLV